MAYTHGRVGTAKTGATPNVLGEIVDFNYTEARESTEVVAMSQTSKRYASGLIEGSGNVTVNWDPADSGRADIETAFSAGSVVTLALYPEDDGSGAWYYTGDVTIEQIEHVNSSATAIVSSSFTFRGTLTKTQVP